MSDFKFQFELIYAKYLKICQQLKLLQCESEDLSVWVIYPVTFSV